MSETPPKNTSKKVAPRASPTAIEDRITQVKVWLCEGYTRHDVVQKGSKLWQITERQVDDYIARAKDILKELNAITREDNLMLATNNLWEMYREARLMADQTSQLNILKEIIKLKGLAPETINHIVEDKRTLTEMPIEDISGLIESYDSH